MGSGIIRIVPGQILKNGNFSAGSGIGSIRFDKRDLQTLSRMKTADIFSVLNLTIADGAFFTKNDVEKRSKFVVIGPKIKLDIGQSLKVDGQSPKMDRRRGRL